MQEKKLNEIVEIIAGQSPTSSTYNELGNGLPFFQGNADFGDLYPKVRIWCSKPIKKSLPNDILISVRAPVGAINFTNVEACIGRGLAAIRCGKSVDRNYLYHYLKGKKYFLESVSTGSTFKAITIKTLKNLEILHPPLPIQQRIAEILDNAAALRDKTAQLLEEYDQLAQSMFLEMFGDPVTNPKGWEYKTIDKLVKKEKGSIKRGPFGGALKKEIFVNKGYLVYEQYHALNNDFSFERYYINERDFNRLKSFEVKPGDIIISCSGVYLGKLAVVPEGAKRGIINQALLKISLEETKINKEFFVFHFTQPNFRDKYFSANRGAGIPNFPPIKEFKNFPFISPPINLQNQFAEKVALIERQKELAKQQLKESEDLFQALLQKTFKGELG